MDRFGPMQVHDHPGYAEECTNVQEDRPQVEGDLLLLLAPKTDLPSRFSTSRVVANGIILRNLMHDLSDYAKNVLE